jgi:ADP-heptose:LPS heptosyltransferase
LNLLFVTSTRIGDAVLSTGLLDHLITRHPGLRVTVACGTAAAPLFAAVPGLARVVSMEKRALLGHWIGLWLATTGQRWDLVVDLRGSAMAWLLRAGARRVWRRPAGDVHRVVQLAALLGLDAPPAPRIWLAPAHHAAASRVIPDGVPVLALGPIPGWLGKQWKLERFAALALRLTARDGPLPDARLAVFAAPGERAAAAPLIERLPRARTIDAIDAGDLLTVAAALQRCRLFIGNDSGLMHLAAAAGVPTLGLFGPSDDRHYAPWGAGNMVVRTKLSFGELEARRRAEPARVAELMDTLDVEAAWRAALSLLQRADDTRAGAPLAARQESA